MGARSFVCLTNIPTPYRIFQFRLMYQELAAREWDFEVLFMARWERGRNWSFEESEFTFPHRFLRGIHINNAGGCAWHLNVGILSTLRQIRPEILLVGGSWTTPTVWIAGIARTAHRKIFWSESHLDSIRRR
ncbi:MAG TPA: hypothetical protein VM912_08405 [Terriglobales bacterium]|nr:hypothetical protein [Terriglobales bacterium]